MCRHGGYLFRRDNPAYGPVVRNHVDDLPRRYEASVKQRAKLKLQAVLRLDAYRIVNDAVERGARWGLHRHYKYLDTCPTEVELDDMACHVAEGVMTEIAELLEPAHGNAKAH